MKEKTTLKTIDVPLSARFQVVPMFGRAGPLFFLIGTVIPEVFLPGRKPFFSTRIPAVAQFRLRFA